MGVSLSIKDVPEALAERLRRRASANHRSLQKELMAIVEAAVVPAEVAGTESDLISDKASQTRHLVAPSVESGYAAALAGAADDLLAELDAIVAGSHWGEAPLLTREQAHDRRLAREIDFDARVVDQGTNRAPRLDSPAK